MNRIFFILFLLFSTDLIAQNYSNADKIYYSPEHGWQIDLGMLENKIGEELTVFRRNRGLSVFLKSERSNMIAGEQSEYMRMTGKISHERDSMDFTKRVRSIIGNGHFGENLYYTNTPEPLEIYKKEAHRLKSQYGEALMWELDDVTYTNLASYIIKKWIESPSHFKNLINPLWNCFSVSSRSSNRGIYVTLIFEE